MFTTGRRDLHTFPLMALGIWAQSPCMECRHITPSALCNGYHTRKAQGTQELAADDALGQHRSHAQRTIGECSLSNTHVLCVFSHTNHSRVTSNLVRRETKLLSENGFLEFYGEPDWTKSHESEPLSTLQGACASG